VNEAALRATIVDATTMTTVLVVAHRLSTVTVADRIVVMDTGTVRALARTPKSSRPTPCTHEPAVWVARSTVMIVRCGQFGRVDPEDGE
jgi:ABC-type branched-subunit amino acid transport system ATPase component